MTVSDDHCCGEMKHRLIFDCSKCADSFECPDSLIYYNQKFDEYGLIIHDGGNSCISISFCPFCGTKLPASKRDLWFDTLEAMGVEDPSEQDIPKEFTTSEWHKKRKH